MKILAVPRPRVYSVSIYTQIRNRGTSPVKFVAGRCACWPSRSHEVRSQLALAREQGRSWVNTIDSLGKIQARGCTLDNNMFISLGVSHLPLQLLCELLCPFWFCAVRSPLLQSSVACSTEFPNKKTNPGGTEFYLDTRCKFNTRDGKHTAASCICEQRLLKTLASHNM